METGNKDEKIKSFLSRSLSFFSAGDTINYFLALVRLFPENTGEIIEIVYRFRGDGDRGLRGDIDKFKELMKVLVNEAIRNPNLVLELEKEIAKTNGQRPSQRIYEGRNLSEWVRNASGILRINKCKPFYLRQ